MSITKSAALIKWMGEWNYIMVLSDWVVAYIKYKTWIEQPEFIYSCFCVWVYILRVHVWMQCKRCGTCVGGLCSCVHGHVHCVYACMHRFMCADARAVFVYVDLCVYIVYSCVHRCAWICMHTCICVSTHVHTVVCIWMYVCIQRCVFTDVYVCGVCVHDL